MNTQLKYDPEDLESLLMHKEFHELYPEEREFVLRHIENATEYASLRKTLHEVIQSGKQDLWQEPDPSIRQNILAQMVREERKGFTVWLNSLFAAPKTPFFHRRSVQFAFAGLAIIALVSTFVFLNREDQMSQLAQTTAEQESSVSDTSSMNLDAQVTDAEQLIAEVIIPSTLPPAPKVVSTTIDEIPQIEDVQETQANANDYLANQSSATLSTVDVAQVPSEQKWLEDLSKDSEVDKAVVMETPQQMKSISKKENLVLEEMNTISTSLASVSMKEWDSLLDLLYTAP